MNNINMDKLQQDLSAAFDFVVNDVKEKFKELNQGPAILDSLRAFIAAVDWTEHWIIALLATHVVLLLMVVLLRKNATVQGTIFFGIMAAVYNAERLNRLAAQHWQSFATQNYFDQHGIFTSAVLSGPLLVIMFVQLVHYLLATAQLLIQMKRKELLFKARQQQKAAGKAGDAKKEK